MRTRHTTRGGKSEDSKAVLQSIIVKLDRQTHIRFKVKTSKHGTNMASVIRKAIDQYLL